MSRGPEGVGIRAERAPPRHRGGHSLRPVILILLTMATAGCRCLHPAEPAKPTGELPDQEATDIVLTETDQGTPAWKLYASHAAIYNAKNVIRAYAIRVDFFDKQGTESSELTARELNVQLQSHDMTARGDVVLQTQAGTRMFAQEVHLLHGEQHIVCPVDRMVRVERAGDVLTGYGFKGDLGTGHFEFLRRVRAVVRPLGTGETRQDCIAAD
jgi:LPS export ABC transporter protein LptC